MAEAKVTSSSVSPNSSSRGLGLIEISARGVVETLKLEDAVFERQPFSSSTETVTS